MALGLVAGLARAAAPSVVKLPPEALVAVKAFMDAAKQTADDRGGSGAPTQRLLAVQYGLATLTCARELVGSDVVLHQVTGVNPVTVADALQALRVQLLDNPG